MGITKFGIVVSVLLGVTGGQSALAISPGELDGHWSVQRMLCNSSEPNESVESLYRGSNYISVQVNGNSGAFVDYIDKCRINMPLTFSYTDAYLLASFTGVISCSAHSSAPAACDQQTLCGKPLPVTVAYQAELLNPGTLYWKSTDPTFDINCTDHGMQNPVEYYMKR